MDKIKMVLYETMGFILSYIIVFWLFGGVNPIGFIIGYVIARLIALKINKLMNTEEE